MEQFEREWRDRPEARAKELLRAAAETAVFGRVSPAQKRELIQAIRENGRTVAMIGDGVNDVLALKEADCSIAMAAGSDAAQHASQMVLLSSDFAAMPKIVNEGRRVINNIQRSASLFLVKNLFSFLITLTLLFAAMPYPFVPIQLTLISGLLIGVPSFLLTLDPAYGRIEGKFLRNILMNALPGGLTAAVAILSALWLGARWGLPMEEISTICTLAAGLNGILVLAFLCRPFSAAKAALIAALSAAFAGASVFLAPLFRIETLSEGGWSLLFGICGAIPLLLGSFVMTANWMRRRPQRRKKTGRVAFDQGTMG